MEARAKVSGSRRAFLALDPLGRYVLVLLSMRRDSERDVARMEKSVEKAGSMTVKEAILLLEKMPDKTMEILVDCPQCGRGRQLAAIDECVVLRSEEAGEL